MSATMNKHPSASTTKIPTIQSLQTAANKRSISYTATPEGREPSSPSSSKDKTKIDPAECDQRLKASLTEMLNSGEVKSDSRGRKVQNLLMETQKDLRRQRRASLGEQQRAKKAAALGVMEERMK
ncbi:hypothetical protein BJX64DRAFT_290960 [Aspergillus heterothallicus]